MKVVFLKEVLMGYGLEVLLLDMMIKVDKLKKLYMEKIEQLLQKRCSTLVEELKAILMK